MPSLAMRGGVSGAMTVGDNPIPIDVRDVALAKYRDGRLELVAITADPSGLWRSVWHASQNKPGGEVWEGWESLGNPPGGVSLDDRAHAIARNADGRLEVVTVSRNGSAWHAWQHHPGGDWTGWRSLGMPPGNAGSIGCPVLAVNKDGRLELFTLKRDPKTVWHRRQDTPGGDWSAWASLDTPNAVLVKDSLEVAQARDGRLEVFVCDVNEVWHRRQKTPGGDWLAWAPLGPPVPDDVFSGPVVAQNTDGRLELFVNGVEGVWHRWRRTPGGDDWSAWAPLGRPDPGDRIRSIAAAPNADGRLLLVANPASRGTVPVPATAPPPASSHSLWQRTQFNPGDSKSDWLAWSPLVSTPGIRLPRLASDPIQRLHLFGALAPGAGGVYLANQTSVNGSHWASSTWPPPPEEIGRPPDL